LLDALNAGKLKIAKDMQAVENELMIKWGKEKKQAKAKYKAEQQESAKAPAAY